MHALSDKGIRVHGEASGFTQTFVVGTAVSEGEAKIDRKGGRKERMKRR
jgi:hypothetical protein